MGNPGCEHWSGVKRVFRYLGGSSEYSIFYHSDVSWYPHLVDIHGYIDSNLTGDVDRMRSMSGYVF
jgi:hypothetical protein